MKLPWRSRHVARPVAAILSTCALVGALSLALGTWRGADAQTAEVAQTIAVAGEGTATGTPDVATISLSVQSEARTAREAIDASSSAMAAVIDALKRIGIPENNLKTTGIQLNPMRARPRPDDTQPPPVTGYQAVNSLSVTVEPAVKAGEALDVAIGAGANVAGGIQFAVKDDSEMQKRALDAAVKATRVKADAMAAAAGLRVTGIRTMTDEGGAGVPVFRQEAQALTANAAGAAPPVQPGELTLRARVRVVYTFG
jgi:uncharacterized protein